MLSDNPVKKVLVVDDNEDVLRSMKILLELGGLKVTTVEDGEKAFEEIKSDKYDLLILDVAMPRIDGVKLFQMVKDHEEYRGTPVLFTSGFPIWTEPEGQRKRIFHKAEAYIQKPFNTEVFMETVRKLLTKQTTVPPAAESRSS
ncbi:MAG: response regulator [Candidatus Hydrogenedentota bacterium]|nr:MAG: response regulator [Candidatus Hydrogenedentota bacterium]